MQRSFLMKTCVRVVAVAAVGLLVAGAAPAAEGSDARAEKTVRVHVQLDAEALKSMRQSPMADHLRRMAEELRLSTEARVYGKAAPTMSTDVLQVTELPSGMTRARLGVSHLNTALVRFTDTGEAVHSCVDGAQAPAAIVETVATSQSEVQ
ncbi:MAG: hypothetical protein AAGE94_08710 [Acidobacteriota bacterium]